MVEPEVVLRDLGPVLPAIWDGFAVSTDFTQGFFEREETALDPSLAHNLLRWNFKRYMAAQGYRVQDLKAENIANNGLYFVFEGRYHIRMWKMTGPEPDLPPVGQSTSKDLFLRQLVFDLGAEDRVNLVILWQVDKSYKLLGLHLLKPRYEPTMQRDIEYEWKRPIEHPLLSQPAVPAVQVAPQQPDLDLHPIAQPNVVNEG